MSSIDLVILGIVLEKPQSAYDIQKDVEYHHLSRWTKISVPSIYRKVLQLSEKFLAFIDTVNCARKGSVALRRSRFRIGLCYGHIEFLEDVGKAALCDLVPLNGCGLGCGNDIADSGIHFLKDIRGIAADKDILKSCHSIRIGHSVLIHRKPT